MNWLTEVWTPASIASALVGGLVIGYALARVLPASPDYSRLGEMLLGFVVIALIGTTFYVGQTLATLLAGDATAAPRVTSRFALWLMFAAALCVGSYVARTPKR